MSERSAARAVVLAAGKGTRMRSRLPKAWHRVGGLTLLEHSLRAASEVTGGEPIAVVPELPEELRSGLAERAELLVQRSPRGTAAAFLEAREALQGTALALVLPSDLPLLRPGSLRRLLSAVEGGAAAALLTATVAEPGDLGRVVRSPDGRLQAVVEAADEERGVGPAEVNVGAYAFLLPGAWGAVERLRPDNAQGELYLSWVPQLIEGEVALVEVEDQEEAIQVNDRLQLAAAEAALRRRTLRRLMLSGVTVVDPEATWVDCDVEVGQDTVIAPGSVLRGTTRIGPECVVGPFAELENVELGRACRVGRSQLSGCKLGDGVDVGPFNRVRPESEIASGAHLGTFTELVRSRVGEGSQVPHLSYLGDAVVGRDVNYGAGSISANWDGLEKHQTVIEDGARLGSGTIMVAPVRIGARAYTGAGSVITEDVPPDALALGRSRQRNLLGWVRRRRGIQGSDS